MTRLALATLALTVLVLAVCADAWRSFDPRTADFAAFYSGAILWENKQPAYDLNAGCEIQRRVDVDLCMPFFHPPVLLPLLSAVANENYIASYWRWAIVLLLIVLLCTLPIYELTNHDLIKAVVLIYFFPLFAGVLQGQDTAFVLLGALLCALLLRDGRDSLAGVALALTVLRPHLAIALGVPLLFARPKAFRAFFVTGLLLVGFSFLLVGAEGFRDIVSTMLLSAHGTDASTHQKDMFNLVGIFARAGLNPFLAWPFFIAAIVVISILWHKKGVTLSTFGIAITLALLSSPHLHTHDLALLIVPLLAWPAIAIPLVSFGMLIALPFHVAPLFIFAIMLALIVTPDRQSFITRHSARASD